MFLFIGDGTLMFSATEHLAQMGDSPESLIMTSMIGGGLVIWSVLRVLRTKPQQTWRVEDARYPNLVRVAQGSALMLPLLLLAFVMVEMTSSSPGRDGTRPTSWVNSPMLTIIAGNFIGAAFTLRWLLEVRAHE